MDVNAAYALGYAASDRTRTYDLDAASDRFTARHGREFETWFAAGWADRAADLPKGYALAIHIQHGMITGTHTAADWSSPREYGE